MGNDWRGYLLKLRWQAARAMAPRRTVHSRGLRFTLQCENWKTHYRWATYNAKEPETLDWIDRWVVNGDTVFDIGANIGVYALYVALRHPKATVIAFEPEYANLHLLKDNIVENGLRDRVQVYSVALSNHIGMSYLHLQDFTSGSALHTESRDVLQLTQTHLPVIWREGICATTLDRFCEETGLHPHLLKIDVDGGELAILEGSTRTLQSQRLRSLLIECADPLMRHTCSRLLHEAGFQRLWNDPSGKSANEVWARETAPPRAGELRIENTVVQR